MDDEDVILRRTWDELSTDVKQRGRAIRRRKRVARAIGLGVVVLICASGAVAISRVGGGDGQQVRVETPVEPQLAQPVTFVRLFDGGAQGSAIFVVQPDGSGLRELSRERAANDGSPAVSPDGTLIAFQSERDNGLRGIKRITDIYVMGADGSDVQRVTTTRDPGPGNGVRGPAWSPDGKQLAAAREDNQDRSRIIVMSPDGSKLHEITDGTGDVGPVWSPDGAWIAFRRRQPSAPNEELWLVRPDGTDAHRVLAKIHDAPVSWTSDGQRVTFADDAADGTTQLFTVSVDGADRTQRTHGKEGEQSEAAWSSDDRLFVHRSDPDGPRADANGREPSVLVVATPDGRALHTLTNPPDGADDYGPSLGPRRG